MIKIKAKDNFGVWHYGFLQVIPKLKTSSCFSNKSEHEFEYYICSDNANNFEQHIINPNTICKSIDYSDISDNLLYVGDFVQVVDNETGSLICVGYINYNKDKALFEVFAYENTISIEECVNKKYYLRSLERSIKDEQLI